MYAIVAFVAVVITFGLETAYFRYSNLDSHSPTNVLKTALSLVFISAAVFLTVVLVFTDTAAVVMKYPEHPEYITWMALTLAFDAWSAIPLAYLRRIERPVRFAVVNGSSILVNIGLNVFLVGFCFEWYDNGTSNWFMDNVFDPGIGVGYIFIANMIASATKFVLLLPVYGHLSLLIDRAVSKEMLKYALPLMVAGLAGIINETLDRRLIRVLLEPEMGPTKALAQVGIYSACYKLSIVITLFIQAFRYAAEPFFFAKARDSDSRQVYADVMHYLILVVSFIFLIVLFYLDVFKLFIRTEAYWEGLGIVPILLLANIFLGMYYNFSVWYKMTHMTLYGAYMAGVGAVITIALNWYLVPKIGYEGAAWATIAAYGSMMCLSYRFGQKYFRIPYNMKAIIGYLGLSVILYGISTLFDWDTLGKTVLFNSMLLFAFTLVVLKFEGTRLMRLIKKS
jgi:O-antigen/teichoic acid export membrane protein